MAGESICNKKLCYDICLILFTLAHILLGVTNLSGMPLKINDVDGIGSTIMENFNGFLIFLIYFPSMCFVLLAQYK